MREITNNDRNWDKLNFSPPCIPDKLPFAVAVVATDQVFQSVKKRSFHRFQDLLKPLVLKKMLLRESRKLANLNATGKNLVKCQSLEENNIRE